MCVYIYIYAYIYIFICCRMIYYTVLYYVVILHLTFILLLICDLFKGNNGKVKLERSKLWQLDSSRRKACE